MKISIKKKGERYLLLISDEEKEVKGIFLDHSDLRRLGSNIEEILEYGNEVAGDDI